MLERDKELAELDGLIEAAKRGDGSLAVVEGPAGIGKTELLRATAERNRANGVAVLTSSGDHLEREFPFGVVRGLFEPELAGASGARYEELLTGPARRAATAIGLDGAEESLREDGEGTLAALHGLYWLCANLAAEQPLLIVVDDAHWADPASLRWLAYLGRRVEDLPVVLALGVRSGEPESASTPLAAISALPPARVINPAPLSDVATGRLIGDALGAEPEQAFVEGCQRATGGNPFLVSQLASALAADEVNPSASEAGRLADLGPETVARALVLRLGNLPAAAGSIAQALAVLGPGSDLWLAAALAECDENDAAEAADALARVEILEAGRPFRFVHPIVQAAIHEDMGAGRRARLHRKAARLLAEAGAEPTRTATHLLASEPAADPWVVETLRAAAGEARARGAPDAAVGFLARALREPVGPESRTQLLIELGMAEALTNAPSAVEHLRKAYDALTDPVERGATAIALGRVLLFAGTPPEAVEVAREARAALPATDDMSMQLEAFEYYVIAFGTGELDPLLRLADLPAPGPDAGLGAKILAANAALVATYTGRPRAACIELALAALAGGELIAADNGGLNMVAATLALVLSDRDEALEVWEEALADAHQHGSLFSLSAVHLWLGYTRYRRGELEEAEELLEAASEEFDLYGYGAEPDIFCSALLGAALVARGRLDEARTALARGEGTVPAGEGRRWWLVSRVELLLAEGSPDEALKVAEELEAASSWVVNPAASPWRSLKAQALDRLGRRDAIPLAEEEVALARDFGAPVALGRALRVLGTLEREAGLEHLRRAVGVLREAPARLELAEALTTLGAVLRRAGERKAAREPLREALDLAHRCGAALLEQRAREELAATGARPRRAVLSGLEALTPSELRVARMAGEGMSNREIAQTLFVSSRTVETHLGHVYQKLDLGSREGIAAALAGDHSAPAPKDT